MNGIVIRIAGALLASLSAAPALAQADPAAAPTRSRILRLDSCLQDAARLAGTLPLQAVRRAVGEGFVSIDGAGRAHVEIVGPEWAPPISTAFVSRFGGLADTAWRSRRDAWVPLDALVPMARVLPPGYRVVRANAGEPDEVVGEGPAAIGSDVYRNGGANGAGVVIAIIDSGYNNLSAARANGDAPALANTTLVNYTPYAFESLGTHGTGCVEAAFDHCPGATWRLYKIDSLSDMGTAVSNAIASGVDVISHSLSRYNQGWTDGTGAACSAAQQAAAAGIAFFTSAGNRAEQHWQGTFNAGGGNASWHDWSAGDETLRITLGSGSGIGFYLSWNTGAGSADYDLYLYDATMSTVLASSTAGGSTFEEFYWENTGPSTVTVNLVVGRYSGATLEFEVFGHGGGTWEYFVSAGSTTSPSNSTHANVISVGAVNWWDFGSPPGTAGIQASYSSRGPSNSGMTLPDLAGPTETTGFTYGAGFGGTSCSTPNSAGAACALWSSQIPWSGSAVRWLLLEQSRLHRDWGTGGLDNVFGHGGASLAPFAANTTWLARGYGNTSNLSTGPYYTLAAAQGAAASGGRILTLPGSYSEKPVTLNKALRVESWEGSAVMGQ